MKTLKEWGKKAPTRDTFEDSLKNHPRTYRTCFPRPRQKLLVLAEVWGEGVFGWFLLEFEGKASSSSTPTSFSLVIALLIAHRFRMHRRLEFVGLVILECKNTRKPQTFNVTSVSRSPSQQPWFLLRPRRDEVRDRYHQHRSILVASIPHLVASGTEQNLRLLRRRSKTLR